MTKKNTPNEVSPVLDPKLKKALEESSSVFDSRSDYYTLVSNDIKSTELYLRSKGLKDVFTCNFERTVEASIEGELSDYDNNNTKANLEAIDWRFDHVSKKFRLMVTTYKRIFESGVDNKKDFFNIVATSPLMEQPIQTRVFYHPRLEKFIRLFAERLSEHTRKGEIYKGEIADFLDSESEEYKIFPHTARDLCTQADAESLRYLENNIQRLPVYPGGISETLLGTFKELYATEEELQKQFEIIAADHSQKLDESRDSDAEPEEGIPETPNF